MGNDVRIVVSSTDNASKTFATIKGNADGLGGSLGKIGQIASGIVVGQGIEKLGGFLVDAVQAAADDEAGMVKLKKAVENTGASFDTFSGQLDDSISTAQRRGYSDDSARNSLSLLMAQTGDTTEAMKRFSLAQDLSRGSGLDLEMASKLVGKVTEENANVFKKMGINLAAGASEAEAFAAIQQKFGGQSEAYANSTAGHFEAVKIQMGELKEKIGYQLLPVMTTLGTVLVEDIIPAITAMGDYWEQHLKPVIEEFVKTKVIPELSSAFAQLKQTIDGLMPVAKEILQFFKDNPAAIAALTVVLGVLLVAIFPIPAGIIAIITAGTLLLAHWDEIRAEIDQQIAKFEALKEKILELPVIGPIVQAFFDGLVLMVKAAWENIKATIQMEIDWITGIITLATDLWHGDFGKFWEDLKTLVQTMFDDVWGIFNIQLGLIKDLIGVWLTAWVGVVTDAAVLFKDAGFALLIAIKNGMIDALGYVVAWISGVPSTLLSAMGDLGGSLASAILKGFKIAWNAAADVINKALPNEIGFDTPFGFVGADFPDNPIPRLARGGIVNKPTLAMIGESGPEAVVPLGRGGMAGGSGVTVIINAPNAAFIDPEGIRRILPTIARELQGYLRTSGAAGLI